ncbi:hypothetical protein OMW55_12445 [Sphingomonas sp. BN140010]|uniref:Uncharacterized protein n=1 Tax=Sphingomonas arvum TaxID=2992113 RepID=A0ABT3JI01_9SPHN|nr:hypothetical protein [Sphingomonas sp. BN140010]MCW3798616.1 hypothetical protein [Sphingomonas sp. BN140010]
MIAQGILGATRRRAAAAPAASFGGMPALFSAGQKGAYYDFTNRTKLAVNADGSGGSPGIGATARWAVDQSPNGNHLRNTVGTVSVVDNGIVTSGSNYGLFNMGGFGDWPRVDPPFELIATLQQEGYGGIDARLLDLGGVSLLQGSRSGKIRAFASGYGSEVAPGLAADFTVHLIFNGPASSIAINGAPPSTDNLAAQPCTQVVVGSDVGGNNAVPVRVKRLFIRSGALNQVDRAGVMTWVSA